MARVHIVPGDSGAGTLRLAFARSEDDVVVGLSDALSCGPLLAAATISPLKPDTLDGPDRGMHKSLTVGANRTLIAIYATGVALLLVVTGNVVFLACLIGSGVGVAAGLLQRSVLQSHARAFAQTMTATDVRRVMTSTRAGTAAVSMTWFCAIILLVQALFFGQVALAPVSWFAGFFAFMLVRDVIAYSALRFPLEAAVSDRTAPS